MELQFLQRLTFLVQRKCELIFEVSTSSGFFVCGIQVPDGSDLLRTPKILTFGWLAMVTSSLEDEILKI